MAPGKTSKRRVIAGMSGAQAAAGDLLRARAADAPSEEETVDEALLAAATAVFQALETYYKALRTYQDGHPALERFYGQLEEKLRAALGKHGAIEAAVTPIGLEISGRMVYGADRPDQNTWFPLYRDGIREISITEGMDRDQIARLCSALVKLAAIKPGGEEDDGEDDAVTLLWDLALEDFGYVAIDTFVDSDAPDEATRARVEKIREMITASMMKELVIPVAAAGERGSDLAVAKRLKSIALQKADLTALERDNFTALAEIPARVKESRGDLYSIAPSECEQLRRGLANDPEQHEKVLDAIVQALVADGARAQADALCVRLERAFTAVVVEGKLERAIRLRRHVITATRARPDAAVWPRIEQAMCAPATVAALSDALATRDDVSVKEALALLELMPVGSARVLLASLGKIEQRKRRRMVCAVAARWGGEVIQPTVELLNDAGEDLALDFLYLLKRVGTDTATAALEKATHHASPAIRAAALRMYIEGADLHASAPRLRNGLRDSDTLVRAAALELVVARRPDGAVRWIKDAIDGDKFAEADIGEKKRLFHAYAALGGDPALEELLGKLTQRNLLGRGGVDEEREAAAGALGAMRYQPARDALEKLSKAMMTRASVKAAAAEALADLDKPRAAEPAYAADPEPEPYVPEPEPATALPVEPKPVEPKPVEPQIRIAGATRPPPIANPRPAPVIQSRPDTRSASGKRPIDDGVAVPRGPRGPKRDG